MQKRGQLVGARKSFLTCAAATCPAAVRDVCRKHLDEVDLALPTIAVRVTRDGRDVAVPVKIDGKPVAEGPDGTIPADPGPRRVEVNVDGRTLERLVELRVGAKRTPVVFEIAPPPRPVEIVKAAPPPSRTASYVVGGVGVAALVGSGVFGFKWLADASCRPNCSPAEVDRIETDALVTDVLLGTGLVALGVATVLWLTAPPRSAALSPWRF